MLRHWKHESNSNVGKKRRRNEAPTRFIVSRFSNYSKFNCSLQGAVLQSFSYYYAMFRKLNRNSKTITIRNIGDDEEPRYSVKLTGANEGVSDIIFLEKHQLVVVASHDKKVRVYDLNGTGEPRAVFHGHSKAVTDLVALTDDVVASIQSNYLHSWRASSVESLSEWHHSGTLKSIAGDSGTVVYSNMYNTKKLIILAHSSGASLNYFSQLDVEHYRRINKIVLYKKLMITCSHDRTTKLWDLSGSFGIHETSHHSNGLIGCDLNENRIVTLDEDGHIYVYCNASGYSLQFIL